MSVETKSSKTKLDRDSLTRVQKLLLLLAKTFKSIIVYPSNSPVIRDHKELLNKEFQSFLTRKHVLTVTISESNLLIGDQMVYQEETRSKNLAFLLHRDGLREISFYDGVTGQEFDDLLEALSENWVGSEDTDVVSSLWEKDFHNIKYFAIDEIFTGLEESDERDSNQSEVTTRLSCGTIALRDEESKQLKNAESGLIETKTTQKRKAFSQFQNAITLNDQDLEKIKKIVEEDKQTFNPARELANALSEMLFLEENPDQYTHVLEVLEEYLSQLVSDSNFGMAYEVIRALIEFDTPPSHQPSKYKMLVDTIMKQARSPDSIDKIRRLLRKRIMRSLEDLFNYVTLLGVSSTPILIDMLLQIEDPEIHSKARNLLTEFVRADVGYFEEWLSDSRVNLVKQIVSILGQAGLEDAIPYLERCLDHPDMDVRLETIRALSRIGEVRANSLLVKFLSDPNERVRLLAVRSLNNLNSDSIELACNMIRQKGFNKKNMIEKKTWVDFLRRTGSDDVVKVLRKLLKYRSWFRRKQNDELKVYVASALGSIATESAMEVLLEGTEMKNKKVSSACRHALQRARRTKMEQKTAKEEI